MYLFSQSHMLIDFTKSNKYAIFESDVEVNFPRWQDQTVGIITLLHLMCELNDFSMIGYTFTTGRAG